MMNRWVCLGLLGVLTCVLARLALGVSEHQVLRVWLFSGSVVVLSALVIALRPRFATPAHVHGAHATPQHAAHATDRAVGVAGPWLRAAAEPMAFGVRVAHGSTLRSAGVPLVRDEAASWRSVEALRVANQALADEIAQRQAAADTLRDSERRYRQVVDSLPDMVVVCRQGHIVFMNSTGARLSGLTSEKDAVGMRFTDLVETATDARTQWHSGARAIGGGSGAAARGRLIRPDSTPLDVEFSCTSLIFQDDHAEQYIVRDISDRVRSEEIMHRMAFHDALTGLPNRALFLDRLSTALAHARRDDEYVAVAFLDLDNFKKINDSLGHDAGDAVLVEVASRLSETLRDDDTVARYGGDEFTIVARIASHADASALAERLLDALKPEVEFSDTRISMGGSVGIAIYPRDGVDETALLRCADAAMYAAKAHGGSVYRIGEGPIMATRAHSDELWSHAYAALAAGELEVRFSPILDVDAGRFLGVEALPYWKHPTRGWIEFEPPTDPQASREMPSPILDWLVSSACAAARDWQTEGLEFGRVTVRLNAKQFDQSDTVARVLCALERARLDPRVLEIGVAETAAVVNPEPVCEELSVLTERGVRVTIDGLGGPSGSMCCLTRFPAEALRISCDLVGAVESDPGAAIIVGALIELACDLGIDVVAAGVDSLGQLELLREQGCHLIQGPLTGGALPANEVGAILDVGVIVGSRHAEVGTDG